MSVALVGAGPGDPGLLTLRGRELLGRADVVIHDRLVTPELLALAPPDALIVDVGKRPGDPGRQQAINELMIEHARAGRAVVRLKGGDPFVFGRGGEESAALREAGVDHEVVPGVSSAFAVPAAAGIPVTHRELSSSVTVVTGHTGDPAEPGGVDWDALGRGGGTLVILMGMAERTEIAARLLASGREPTTPVAVVHWGTTDAQQVIRSTLAGLADVELPAPAVMVIGPVAALDLGTSGTSGAAGTT
ncbi:MAG: uroporphyrinogen-III C-methyltransferase [Acidimicrobiales bacterium]